MVLTAIDSRTGKRVLAAAYKNGAELYEKHPRGTLISPFPTCDLPVYARFAKGRISHFFHPPGVNEKLLTECCHPYSYEHEAAKAYVAASLKESEGFDRIEFEVAIPSRKRIVDVMGYQGEYCVAIEVQLSPITTDVIATRTADIEREGIDVLWALGGKAKTATNADFCKEMRGFFIDIEFSYTTQTSEAITHSLEWDEVTKALRNAMSS